MLIQSNYWWIGHSYNISDDVKSPFWNALHTDFPFPVISHKTAISPSISSRLDFDIWIVMSDGSVLPQLQGDGVTRVICDWIAGNVPSLSGPMLPSVATIKVVLDGYKSYYIRCNCVTTCTSRSGSGMQQNPTGDDWVSSAHEHRSRAKVASSMTVLAHWFPPPLSSGC